MTYSTALDRLMTTATVRLPGALETAILDELFIVVDEFLKGSTVWRQMIPIAAQVGVVEYDLAADGEPCLIDQLIGVWDTSNVATEPTDDNFAVTVLKGIPIKATMPTPGTALLDIPPSQSGTYNAIVACTVDEPKTRDGFPLVPTWIPAKYAHTDWLDGLLGRMYSQPAKSYSNQQMAVYHLRRFRVATARARVQATRENNLLGQRWMFPQQFHTRHRRG